MQSRSPRRPRPIAAALALLLTGLLVALTPGAAAGADPGVSRRTGSALVHGPDRGSVERLYRAYFLRDPDGGGMDHWRARRMGGTQLGAISAHFAVSPEFVARYGALDDDRFVRLVYRNVLGRDPDAGGLTHWTALLARHPDRRGLVMLGFSDSPEFKVRTGTAGGCDLGGPGAGSPYHQTCSVLGIHILAGDAVDPEALHRAGDLIHATLGSRPGPAAAMAGVRVLIAAEGERTSSVPSLRAYLDRTDGRFNDRVRGVWIPQLAATVVGEENLMCRTTDNYRGESVLLHELSHGIHLHAMPKVDPTFGSRLDTAYADAMEARIWGETYATANVHEYFAEGVQSYFDANKHGEGWQGLHGPISTRAALMAADPVLHELIREVYGEPRWSMPC